jgi:hypothetical protein
VEEERFCEDARAVVDRATRDARARGGGRRQVSKKTDTAAHPAVGSAASAAPSSAQKAPRNPLALATDPVAAEEEEEAFFDDELMSSSEDEESQESPVEEEAEEEEEEDDDDDSGPASRSRLVLDSRARRIGERSSLLLPTPEKVCLFPAFAKALPTIHRGDDVRNGRGTDEDGVVAEALRELACPRDGVARGEWRVFDDGVAFVPSHTAPPLILTLGGNVDGVDVYDAESESESDDESAERKSFGVARDADVSRAARRRREAFASATTVAFRLKPDVVTASIVSMCFSLAPMPAKSRRRFLREVLPRWKARGGATNIRRVSEEIFSETHALSRRTRVALARARADARSAAASLALSLPRALLRAPVGFGVADAMAEAALDRASRRDAERAAARVDERARRGIFVPGDDDDDDDDDEDVVIANGRRGTRRLFLFDVLRCSRLLAHGRARRVPVRGVRGARALRAERGDLDRRARFFRDGESPRRGRVVRFRNGLRHGFTSRDAARFSGARRTQSQSGKNAETARRARGADARDAARRETLVSRRR